MAKHLEEVDEDVASYAAFQPKWTSSAKLSWRKTKSGRRRARRVGSRGTRSSLPTLQEAKACDAFRETIGAAQSSLAHCGLFWVESLLLAVTLRRTCSEKAVLGGTENRGPRKGFCSTRHRFYWWRCGGPRGSAGDLPGFSMDRETAVVTTL
eukprot:2711476-Amphidinium_carterae.1